MKCDVLLAFKRITELRGGKRGKRELVNALGREWQTEKHH